MLFTLWNGRLGNESCVESVGKRISYMRADLVDNAGRNLSSALFLAMRFGSGACLAAGVTQSLIAALLFTGLGDGLWMWFPCGWSGHLLLYYVKWKTESEVFKMAGEMLKEQIRTGVLSMVGMTITGLILWCIWIQHHDRKSISQ